MGKIVKVSISTVKNFLLRLWRFVRVSAVQADPGPVQRLPVLHTASIWLREYHSQPKTSITYMLTFDTGYFEDGADIDGFDRNNISLQGFHRVYYDEDMRDPFGRDCW